MQEPFSLSGRVALVTGSTQGLGLEMARSLAQAGAKTFINGRQEHRTNKVAERLCAEGLTAFPLPFNVADEPAMRAALARLDEQCGRLDILVNNAALRDRRPLDALTSDDFRSLIDINLISSVAITKVAATLMVRGGYGRIIMVSSTAALAARPGDAAYITAKGGLLALMRALACEYGANGITCNAIAPGAFATEPNAAAATDPAAVDWFAGRVPLQRWGKPEELGPVCTFLAAPASSYVTGTVLNVDGGLLAAAGTYKAPVPANRGG